MSGIQWTCCRPHCKRSLLWRHMSGIQMAGHLAYRQPSWSLLHTVDVDTNLSVATARKDLRKVWVTVLVLRAHNIKYRLSTLAVAVGYPWLNCLDAESVVWNCLQSLWTTEGLTFSHFSTSVWLCPASSLPRALHRSSAGKWCLEIIVTNWLSQISDVTITVKFVGLLSNMDFYAPRWWRIPTAAPPTCILQFYSAWQHYLATYSTFTQFGLFLRESSLNLWFFLNLW